MRSFPAIFPERYVFPITFKELKSWREKRKKKTREVFTRERKRLFLKKTKEFLWG